MPKIIAFITGYPRYLPVIEWSDKSWTHNVFRAYELVFWRRCGQRFEALTFKIVRSGEVVSEGRVFGTLEARIAHYETCVRRFLQSLKPAPFSITIPMLTTTNGFRVPASPFLFAIASDATSGKREASGATPNTISHTSTGSDRHLWANTSTFSNDVTDCDYNGVNLTAVSGAQTNGTDGVVNGPELRYLIAPATGANNLVTTDSSSGSLAVACATYSGCNQSTATDGTPGTTSQETGTSLTVSMTVNTANSWIIAGMNNDQGNFAAGSGTTMRQVDPNYGLADSNGTVATGSQSLVATYTNGRGRAAIATILVASAATTVSPSLTLMGVGS